MNTPAETQKTNFAFFHSVIQLLTHLSALPSNHRFLYFEEICKLLKSDANWKLSGGELFTLLLKARAEGNSGFGSERSFLADLENKSDTERSDFDIPRGNFHGLFQQAFVQTGFFEFRERTTGKTVAVALNPDLDAVLQRRLRFILDHPPTWNGTDWPAHMDIQAEDLPQEVTAEKVEENTAPITDSGELKDLIPAAKANLVTAKLLVTTEQLLRFASSLETKRFLILTGLAGSGKTKLAQAFARWITPATSLNDPFIPGAKIESDRIDYYVTNSDSLSVEFRNREETAEAKRVTLPRAMIQEWADFILINKVGKNSPAKEIRWGVAEKSKFSSQLHSFETHLKAAAFALIENRSGAVSDACYTLVQCNR